MEFEVTTGTTDAGWCDFTVRLGQESWSCHASYLGPHPLYPLIHSTIKLYECLFIGAVADEDAVCISRIIDEPGGILIRATPNDPGDKRVALKIFHDSRTDYTLPDAVGVYVASGVVEYWNYAEAILKDAVRAVARQGFLGLRNGWLGQDDWGFDSERNIMPVEQLFYLTHLVHHGKPPTDSSLHDELELLRMFAEKNG